MTKTANGKGCECINKNFADLAACGNTDLCKAGWVPKGTCDTQCTGDKVVNSDKTACEVCANANKGRVPKSDHSGCECKSGANAASGTDCSCKSKMYSDAGEAYKQTCEKTCITADPKVWKVTNGVAKCHCDDKT